MVEAAPLQRVVYLAGPVRGENDQRRCLGADRPDLGDRHGVVGQHLEQEGLELVVGTVDLVDEQHGRGVLDRPEDRPRDQKAAVIERVLQLRGVGRDGSRFGGAQVQQLAREVPVVQRLRGVDALIALQPDQLGPGDLGECLREARLPDPGVALQKQRPAHLQRQVRGGGQALVGQVSGALQCGGQRGRVGWVCPVGWAAAR